jgi:iron complex transport system ATP-binding protein
MTALLAVDDLAVGYRGRAVCSGVSLSVAAGEVLCLLGPNGGGKTTLFKTILGLLPPISGAVRVDGESTSSWGPRRRARVFGYVPQIGAGQFPFAVREIVLMGRTAHRGAFVAPSAADRRIAEASLAVLGIAHLAERDWTRISGGERQLVLIARALAQEPRIMVLDEPTASLDFGNQLLVLDQARSLAGRGLAVVLSTHHPEQAFACADRVAMLHAGRLARFGAPDAVINSESMQLVYGVDVAVLALAGSSRLRACVPRAQLDGGA